MHAEETVLAAITALANEPYSIAGDLLRADYREHLDQAAGSGAAAAYPSAFSAGTTYDVVRTIVDGDMVLTHGRIRTPGMPALVGMDLWKVTDGRIAERWSSSTPQVETTASGRTQTDGATVPDPTADPGESRRIVTDWTRTVLIGGDLAATPRYLSGRGYAQHNPDVADGIDGFTAAIARLAEVGLSFNYRSIDITIADGDFVFTRGAGRLGAEVVLNDLWRVDDGEIVEHWDVVSPIGTAADLTPVSPAP